MLLLRLGEKEKEIRALKNLLVTIQQSNAELTKDQSTQVKSPDGLPISSLSTPRAFKSSKSGGDLRNTSVVRTSGGTIEVEAAPVYDVTEVRRSFINEYFCSLNPNNSFARIKTWWSKR